MPWRDICEGFLWLMLYSFIGWAYETVICSLLKYHKLINRGFHIGPYCPIYGIGAVACWLLLHDLRAQLPGIGGAAAVFVLSGFIACTIEYFISWMMEVLFHARWWDYSERPFNLNGRVCLAGFLVFGIGATLVIDFVQPALMRFTGKAPNLLIYLLAGGIAAAFAADAVVSVLSFLGFSKTMRRVHDELSAQVDKRVDILNEKMAEHESTHEPGLFVRAGRKVIVRARGVSATLKNRELHFIKAFPEMKMSSLRGSGLLEKLHAFMAKGKKNK